MAVILICGPVILVLDYSKGTVNVASTFILVPHKAKYVPHKQPDNYLKNISEIISLTAYSNALLGSVIFKIQSRALNLLILPYLTNACNLFLLAPLHSS